MWKTENWHGPITVSNTEKAATVRSHLQNGRQQETESVSVWLTHNTMVQLKRQTMQRMDLRWYCGLVQVRYTNWIYQSAKDRSTWKDSQSVQWTPMGADTMALVVTKLDYCCSGLVGVSGTLLRRLQSVLNAATRIVFSARSSNHITPLLRELHWLKITARIQFHLCVLVYRCLHGSAP